MTEGLETLREQRPKKEQLVGTILPRTHKVKGEKAASRSSKNLQKNKSEVSSIEKITRTMQRPQTATSYPL